MDESAFMHEFDFLSSDGLNRIIDLMLSHTMLLTGLNGSLYGAINNNKNGGTLVNAKSYTQPSNVGGKGGCPPGLKGVQSTIFGGLYSFGIIQIFKMSIDTHPNNTDEDFNKLAAILTGNSAYIEDGTTLNSRSSAKCPGLKAVGNLPALPCGKLFGPNNLANHAGKQTLGGGVNQLLCYSCCSRNVLKQYELETLRLMEVRDRGQQIRFDLLTATLEKDEEKIKQCKLLEKEEKQRLKNEGEAKKTKKRKSTKSEAKKAKKKPRLADETKEFLDQLQDIVPEDLDLITSDNTTGYHGVRKSGKTRYKAVFKERQLGTFDTLEEAAREYAKAHYIYHNVTTFQIQVPHGLQAGQQRQVAHPTTGVSMFIDVPPGAAPGEKLSITAKKNHKDSDDAFTVHLLER